MTDAAQAQAVFPAIPEMRTFKETPTQAKTTAQRIWDAVTDLFNQDQVVARETLAEITGLRMTIIDDHINRMVSNEQLRRVRAGCSYPFRATTRHGRYMVR